MAGITIDPRVQRAIDAFLNSEYGWGVVWAIPASLITLARHQTYLVEAQAHESFTSATVLWVGVLDLIDAAVFLFFIVLGIATGVRAGVVAHPSSSNTP